MAFHPSYTTISVVLVDTVFHTIDICGIHLDQYVLHPFRLPHEETRLFSMLTVRLTHHILSVLLAFPERVYSRTHHKQTYLQRQPFFTSWCKRNTLSRFIVKRYNSDFPCPVFAALPLVLVAQKTGKFFLGDFVYTAFPEGRVVPTLWCYLRAVFGLYSVLIISAIFFNADSSNSNVSPYSVFNTFSMRRYAPYLKSVSA